MKTIKKKISLLPLQKRLYNVPNPIIGLTGGIATGKSTVSKNLLEKGFHIIDADKLIKAIYKKEKTFIFIKAHYPQVIENNSINFSKLRILLFSSPSELKKVEDFLYPQLKEEFLNSSPKNEKEIIIYDVPLLFEKELHKKVDFSVLVYADRDTQIDRVIKRDNSTRETAEDIIQNQLSLEKKKQMSDHILMNTHDISLDNLFQQVDQLVNTITDQIP